MEEQHHRRMSKHMNSVFLAADKAIHKKVLVFCGGREGKIGYNINGVLNLYLCEAVISQTIGISRRFVMDKVLEELT